MHDVRSLFHEATAKQGAETREPLIEGQHFSLERIVSSGSQPPARYLQDHDEWVLLVQGTAEMLVDGQHMSLHSGEYLLLPARMPHEVLSTSSGAVWLALHLRKPRANQG